VPGVSPQARRLPRNPFVTYKKSGLIPSSESSRPGRHRTGNQRSVDIRQRGEQNGGWPLPPACRRSGKALARASAAAELGISGLFSTGGIQHRSGSGNPPAQSVTDS